MQRKLLAIALLSGLAWGQDIHPEFNVLYGRAEFVQADRELSDYVHKLAAAAQQERERLIANVRTAADLKRFQAETRTLLAQALGRFPARTALHATVTSTLDRGAYSIENVIFESRPHTYVTANVYVPRRFRPPFPAVVATVGHWGNGKAYEDYQHLAAYFSRRGLVVLVYDLPGMGERVEHYNPIFRRTILDRGTSEYFVTTEHGLEASRAMLTGGNLLSYLIWDGMRAVDYLAERQDVDPQRIAATGASGGGWVTEVLAAFDPRIKVAIPVCYGGCIADQLFGAKIGPTDVDALITPRPLLMIGATGDSRDNVVEKLHRRDILARLYEAAGHPDQARFMLAESRHGYTDPMYPVAYEWLRRWLHPEAPPPEAAAAPGPLESEAALACTLGGQVRNALGGETVFSLVRAEARQIQPDLVLPRVREEWPAWLARTRRMIASTIGIPSERPPEQPLLLSHDEKGAYALERVVYYSEPGIYIPGLLFLPKSSQPVPAVVFVNDAGKSTDMAVERYLRPLAVAGYAAFSIDPRGMGESAPAEKSQAADYRSLVMGSESSNLYELLRAGGRSLVGMRCFDIQRAVDYLLTRKEIDGRRISAAGFGSGGLLVLYAAALDERIGAAVSIASLGTYRSITETELYTHAPSEFVLGALRHFDLPGVAAATAPRPLALINTVDAAQRPLALDQCRTAYDMTSRAYALAGVPDKFAVARADSPGEILRRIEKTAR
jgi:dienelactone hydrolase